MTIDDRDAGGAPSAPAATLITLADVEPERVEWLWAGRIPRGKLTLLDGDPGLGKSTIAYDIAARVTRGLPMPNETDGATAADVVILSHEDGLADTIRPRLEAADADLRRVHAIQSVPVVGGGERLPVLPEDLRAIIAAVEVRAAALLIIDPLFAYLASEVGKRSVSPVADDVPRREYIWPSTWPDDERIATSGRSGLIAGTIAV